MLTGASTNLGRVALNKHICLASQSRTENVSLYSRNFPSPQTEKKRCSLKRQISSKILIDRVMHTPTERQTETLDISSDTFTNPD